jgi:uncharacterized protein involved in exopolysaccharide biosynthesis
LLPPQQAQTTAAALLGGTGLAGLASGAGVLSGLKNPSDQWVGMLQSRTIADAIIQQFKLRERYELEYMDEVRKELDDRTNIVVGKDSLINIYVSDASPEVATKLASAYVDELRKMSRNLALGEAAQRRVFFEQQMLSAKEKLVSADLALQHASITKQTLKSVPESVIAGLGELNAKLAGLEVKISVLRGTLTESNPELRATLREREELQQQLKKLESNSSQTKDEQYIAAYRNVKYHETLLEVMARQYELARADEAREGALIQVIDDAVVPERKSSPKRALIALVASGIAFVCIAFSILFRNSRRSQGQVSL